MSSASAQRVGSKRNMSDGDTGAGSSSSKRSRSDAPRRTFGATVTDLIEDELAPLANQYWATSNTSGQVKPFEPTIIDNIYIQHLAPVNTRQAARVEADSEVSKADEEDEEREQAQIDTQRAHRLIILELSGYLENYLWKHFDSDKSTFAHVMSIIILLNQKFKEGLLGIWDCFQSRSDDILLGLFDRILHLKQSHDLTVFEANQYLTFLIHAYNSFEKPIVRKVFMRLVTIDCWRSLRDTSILRVLRESKEEDSKHLEDTNNLREAWKKIASKPTNDFNAIFLPNLLIEFVSILYSIESSSTLFDSTQPANGETQLPYQQRALVTYLERFCEFITDLLTKRATRRWTKKLIQEIHLITLCRQSVLVQQTQAKEAEILASQSALAANGYTRTGTDDVNMDVLLAQTATSGGAVLSNDNHHNTNRTISPAALPGRLFVQLVKMVDYYLHFEVDDVTGRPLQSNAILAQHYLDIQILQKVCFKFFPEQKQFQAIAMANVSKLDHEASLTEMLRGATQEELRQLCIHLQLLPRPEEVEAAEKASQASEATPKKKGSKSSGAQSAQVPKVIMPLLSYMTSTSFLTSLLVDVFTLKRNTREEIAGMPLFPNEQLLFDEHAIPSVNYTGDTCLSLPKLNLQFLTVHDYLQRNFNLYQGESTYEIREDIAYTVKRLKPRLSQDGAQTVFTGWARMACPVNGFNVTLVGKPLIGETKPSSVRAEVTIDLSVFNGPVREEWESLKSHDVLFLLHVQALVPAHASAGNFMSMRQGGGQDRGRRRFDVEGADLDGGAVPDESFKALASEPLLIRTVRGCQVRSVMDQYKKVIGERDEKGNVYKAKGNIRIFRVELDAAQYAQDMSRQSDPSLSSPVYSHFNLVLRRKPAENNFAGVLETIRDLMADTSRGIAELPDWLKNVFLGYGDPRECQYYRLANQVEKLEFVDTFIDMAHMKESFHETIQIAERTTEEIEQEAKGQELNLVALGEGNNRQTAASTSIALTRQVMRLVSQAAKEKSLASGGAVGSPASTIDATNATFRVKFPMRVEPNLEVLQQMLYAREPTSITEGQTDEKSASVGDSAMVDVLVAPTPVPALPEFTLVEPTKPAAAASADSTSSSADVEREIAGLSSLTVVKLKELMSPLELSLTGTKPILIERLANAMREKAKNATNNTNPPPDSNDKYDAELGAYRTARAEYEKKVSEHAAAVSAYEVALAAFEAKQNTAQNATATTDADGDATMTDAKPDKKSSSKKKKKSSEPAAASVAAAAPPAVVIPPSPHTLEVELLPRVHARQGYHKRNMVRFTPIQVEAIKSGLNPGLTLLVGPPGTGKTDTAVQIISELYHNFPEQRTLLITHSNNALNDLFVKIMERDIDERYLVRLGRGSDEVDSSSDMSKFGRVNYMLERRLALLDEVGALARSLAMSDDVAYTCETSEHFFLSHVLARWEKFTAAVQAAQKEGKTGIESFIAENFPFTAYFTSRSEKQAKVWQQYYASQYGADAAAAAAVAPVTLFRGVSVSEDMSIAVSCFADLQTTFVELRETRPFELLRSYKDRSNYLITKHAKIIAMTCTHAAIKRKDLVDLKFQFENIIMEESAQILEIETFIPMLLQQTATGGAAGGSRLKRVILLGDHHQLPPVVKNRAFQRYSHLDQSMFTRFIRLGMPYIQLNAQGRMRSSLAQLWNWNYTNLGDLPAVQQNPAYKAGNVGFAHEYQMINVEDLNGVGESSPTPFFYQNLAEAEYVVQTYMYMRLLGYPASRISILTTYNGQKHLIQDILEQRCAPNLLFGMPAKVSTVDKFQGQQNDFILLSLVRTRTAGHLRDVRRLVVAMSRARLGLYVFGRVSLFSNCFELTRTFNQLLKRPTKLQLLPMEKRPYDQPLATERLITDTIDASHILEVRDVIHAGELVASMTLSVQSEYGEYMRRIHAAQEEERLKREQREQAQREYDEAREATRRADAQHDASVAREIAESKEADANDQEMVDASTRRPNQIVESDESDNDEE